MRRPAKLAGRVVGVEVEVLSETACWARTAPPASSTRTCRREGDLGGHAGGDGSWVGPLALHGGGGGPRRCRRRPAGAAPGPGCGSRASARPRWSRRRPGPRRPPRRRRAGAGCAGAARALGPGPGAGGGHRPSCGGGIRGPPGPSGGLPWASLRETSLYPSPRTAWIWMLAPLSFSRKKATWTSTVRLSRCTRSPRPG